MSASGRCALYMAHWRRPRGSPCHARRALDRVPLFQRSRRELLAHGLFVPGVSSPSCTGMRTMTRPSPSPPDPPIRTRLARSGVAQGRPAGARASPQQPRSRGRPPPHRELAMGDDPQHERLLHGADQHQRRVLRALSGRRPHPSRRPCPRRGTSARARRASSRSPGSCRRSARRRCPRGRSRRPWGSRGRRRSPSGSPRW